MIYTAELVGLARTLFILFAIYWAFRIFARYVLPFLLKYFVQYLGKKAQQQQGRYQQSGYGAQEEPVAGNEKVTIKKTKRSTTQSPKSTDFGEYVDFEEVE